MTEPITLTSAILRVCVELRPGMHSSGTAVPTGAGWRLFDHVQEAGR